MSSLDDFEIDLDALDPNSPYAGAVAANSALPAVLGSLVARNSLTTDDGIAGSFLVDQSPSMDTPEKIGAVTGGVNAFLRFMAGVKKDVRARLFLQRIRYSGKYVVGNRQNRDNLVDLGNDVQDMNRRFVEQIWEDHTLRRLVVGPDLKTLNVPLLTAAEYKPRLGYGTATVPALMKVFADHLLWEAALQHPDIDGIDYHVIGVASDGFMNIGGADKTAQFRRSVKAKKAQEARWKFFAYFIADQAEVEMFKNYMSRLYQWHGNDDQARELMAHAMFTGWGFYANSESTIPQIADPADRALAELYLRAERSIVAMLEGGGGYCGQGGLAFPPENVYFSTAEPEQITNLLGVTMSSSFARASTNMVATSDDVTPTPNPTPLPDDDQNPSSIW